MHFIITFAENRADLNNNSFNNCWKTFKDGFTRLYCNAEPYTNFSQVFLFCLFFLNQEINNPEVAKNSSTNHYPLVALVYGDSVRYLACVLWGIGDSGDSFPLCTKITAVCRAPFK